MRYRVCLWVRTGGRVTEQETGTPRQDRAWLAEARLRGVAWVWNAESGVLHVGDRTFRCRCVAVRAGDAWAFTHPTPGPTAAALAMEGRLKASVTEAGEAEGVLTTWVCEEPWGAALLWVLAEAPADR